MFIRAFHMDGFGIFSHVQVDDLPPGLSIFLGENEAGKSTCLEFLRTTLAGYPDPRSREARRIPPVLHGGRPGGTLCLEDPALGTVHLTRRPGQGGGLLTLADDAGNPLDSSVLQQLLFGINRDVYRNVFGFSLYELQTFDSLTGDGVRNALYGASFGTGLRSPVEALKTLESRRDALFKPSASKPPLNSELSSLEKLRATLRAARDEAATYDELASRCRQCRANLDALRQRRTALEDQRRQTQRRLDVWQQWDEWRKTGQRLRSFPVISPTFPEDGPARLARAQEARQACERSLAAHEEKRNSLRQRRQALVPHAALLEALPALRSLAERKSSYRQALSSLPRLRDERTRLAADLARELERLGPHWDCERIRRTDRGVFADKNLERLADELHTARTAHTTALDALDKAHADVDLWQREVATAAATLEQLPQDEAELDEAERDRLRQTLALLEEGRQRLPGRERAVQQARQTFTRAEERLGMGSGNAPQRMDRLLDQRDEALKLARHVRETQHAAQEARQETDQVLHSMQTLQGRLDRLREEERAIAGPSREALDARAAALRSLRSLTASLTTEQERLRELRDRLEAEKDPAPVKNMALMMLGILFILLGLGMLGGRWYWGLESLPLPHGLSLPMTLWSGYLVLFCGVMALGGGLPRRNGPEARRLRQERRQLESRCQDCDRHVADLEKRAGQLCRDAGVDSMDPDTLETVEVLLERKRELCFTRERSRRDADSLRQELDQLRSRYEALHQKAQEQEREARRAPLRWQECLTMLGVRQVPTPDNAENFFTRVEAARTTWDMVENAEAELAALKAELAHHEARLRAIPAVARRAGDTADADALLDAGRQTLDACRDADALREQRIRATTALRQQESGRDRARQQQAQAASQLDAARERLESAQAGWAACLEGLGLGTDLDPETVRKALHCMETCLSLESRLDRADATLRQTGQDVDALRLPLRDLLISLERPLPDQDGNAEADWTEALDDALAAAEEAAALQADCRRLDSLLAEEDDECRAARAALDEARHDEQTLLDMAGTRDAEDFLRMAAVLEERRATERLHQSYGENLRLAAGQTPLEDFLASFARDDHDEQARHCDVLSAELERLQEEEQQLSAQVADLSVRVRHLASADDLARLRQQEATQRESMRQLAMQWSRLALARELLLTAKQTFERERQPQVIRLASEIFAAITGGTWRGITASLDDTSLRILPLNGEALPPEALSRGTQEQAYLSLRLAYILNHAERATPLPVIMDDVLVNFDPQRASRTAQTFVNLTTGRHGRAHQLLYFTCHPHMADLLRQQQPDCALFRVAGGSISRQ